MSRDRAHGAATHGGKTIVDITKFMQPLTLDEGECAAKSADGTCMTKAVLPILAAVGVDTSAGLQAAVAAAEEKLRCDSESCVLANPQTVEVATSLGLKDVLLKEVKTRFKPIGPRNSTALLSNLHIDAALDQWKAEFPEFRPCPFAMADFETADFEFRRVSLARLYAEGARAFACVLNTDVSRGPGKHWVAVFVDMRPDRAQLDTPWTIEYFNSAGSPPAVAVVRWMERQRQDLLRVRSGTPAESQDGAAVPPRAVETWAVSSVLHQRSQTECGLYSLYYIRRRLEGAPLADFMNPAQPIPDVAMVMFRRHVFRARP